MVAPAAACRAAHACRREDAGLLHVAGDAEKCRAAASTAAPQRAALLVCGGDFSGDDEDGGHSEAVCLALAAGVPALLSAEATGFGAWRAAREWVAPDGAPDVAALVEAFGDALVRVEEIPPLGGTPGASGGYGDRETRSTTLQEYAEWWRGVRDGGGGRLLYLKDWHCAAEFGAYGAYEAPRDLAPDFLNGYYDARRGGGTSAADGDDAATADYRFVYLGPAGSWTSLHSDVLRSSSWSTNVAGRKRWTILPPDATPWLLCRRGVLMAQTLHDDLAQAGGEAEWPYLRRAREVALVLEQAAGETVYVPPGWHHSVENLSDVLSINHNWIHPSGALDAVRLWRAERRAAEAQIAHLRDEVASDEFGALVERNAALNAGLGEEQIVAMLQLGKRNAERAASEAHALVGGEAAGAIQRLYVEWSDEALMELASGT